MPKLRVGIVNYLNSKPLAWGFLKGHHSSQFTPSYHPPALVARLLEQGELDVGLIPSIEVQRIPGLTVLPDLCIAADREVRSVILVARTPVEEIRRVALDHNSRTSAALVQDPPRRALRPDPGVRRRPARRRADARGLRGGADHRRPGAQGAAATAT